jgi:UDP-2-acetamido-2-deoxy-ribo-hexuluronate aminotransferase
MINQYQLDRIWKDIREEVIDSADGFLGQGLAQGFLISDDLEKTLAENAHRKYCVLTANCTDALYISLEILKHQGKIPKDFVAAVPGITWVSTASAVVRAGGSIVFYDIDTNWCLDSSQDFSDVDVIVAVDLLGNSCDWSQLEQQGKIIINDAAQSFTTEFAGKKSLARGEISCTSFGPLKAVPSFGSGGALYIDDEAQMKLAKLLRLHFKSHNLDPQCGIGINSTMSSFEVSSVHVCLKYHLAWQQRREKIANYFYDSLHTLLDVSYKPTNKEVNNTLYKVAVRSKNKYKLIEKLRADSIQVHPVYIPLYSEPVFKSHKKVSSCTNSSKMSFEGLLLPNQHTLTDGEVETIVESMKKYL